MTVNQDYLVLFRSFLGCPKINNTQPFFPSVDSLVQIETCISQMDGVSVLLLKLTVLARLYINCLTETRT
jgi:hypothetical protein